MAGGKKDAEFLAEQAEVHTLRIGGCNDFVERLPDVVVELRAEVPLQAIDLYGTRCDPVPLRAFATKHWPGCLVTLPVGQQFVAAAK